LANLNWQQITVNRGTNMLAWTRKKDILRRAEEKLRESPRNQAPKHWDGRGGARIIEVLALEVGPIPSVQ